MICSSIKKLRGVKVLTRTFGHPVVTTYYMKFKDTLEPQNTLAPNALDWCKSVGSEARTVQEAISDEAVVKAVQV